MARMGVNLGMSGREMGIDGHWGNEGKGCGISGS